MSHNLTKPRDQSVMWLYRQVPINEGFHPAKLGNHKHSNSEDIVVLFCPVIPQGHLFKDLWDLMGWRFLSWVTALPSLLGIGVVVVVIQQLKHFTWPCKATWLKDLGLYGRKLPIVCPHPAKIDSHRHCVNGYTTIWVCHVIIQDYVIKRSCNFMGRIHPR